VETDSLSWVVMPSLCPSPAQLSGLRALPKIHKLFWGSFFKFDAPNIRLAYYRERSAVSVFRRLLYCVIEPGLSRGYLHGLQTMISSAGPSSELAQARTIASLASIGKRLQSTTYVKRAEGSYSFLLRSFRLRISNEAIFTTVESLITAALLGLYEVILSRLDIHDGS
jgi:hypothetical protein